MSYISGTEINENFNLLYLTNYFFLVKRFFFKKR